MHYICCENGVKFKTAADPCLVFIALTSTPELYCVVIYVRYLDYEISLKYTFVTCPSLCDYSA